MLPVFITEEQYFYNIRYLFYLQGFFEEIEDIKFALQQSARLNKEYEQTLRKMCTKFGIPYPHPEKKILDDRSKWK